MISLIPFGYLVRMQVLVQIKLKLLLLRYCNTKNNQSEVEHRKYKNKSALKRCSSKLSIYETINKRECSNLSLLNVVFLFSFCCFCVINVYLFKTQNKKQTNDVSCFQCFLMIFHRTESEWDTKIIDHLSKQFEREKKMLYSCSLLMLLLLLLS